MKKLILLALLITASIFKPAKAQVSLSVNIGSRPYYQPVYYQSHPSYVYVTEPRYVERSYYAPARRVVVSKSYYNARPRVYRNTKVYRTNYYRSAPRHHVVKHHGKGPKHFAHNGHGKRGRH